MTARLILASKSPARTKLLAEAGIRHSVLVSDVDEPAVVAAYGAIDPHDTSLLLARAKAEAVASLEEADGALVVGCDSVFEFDGEAHGKPYEPTVAIERISRMRGRSGVLHTGHWLVDTRDGGSGATIGAVSSATVHFGTMTDDEVHEYVASGEPLQCAGSFTIDGLGGAFIERVDGDPHAVVGLSISTLRSLLRAADVPITALWAGMSEL
ncbi:septum formation inhibitor Maf [Arthrobacter agilis]|uniref:Maf family protein n=1 Tax=Arthrobacter agilis TaxID=37921 RepID=UPI000B352EF4|nr:nucleoside triphosphate pyrophosphatase [Arthrobacter agilis]OUM40459.1 septum formation inhibitor Maf [Arthrobacter agilis]PPB45073.1 septum formation inhibitor Maf [Arthrobacter agilis]TPV27777.1 septum formation inhibitor Maf [Arthrobacter agilis]VDR31570.1 Septum formation protein Maf [Arthrobacter agilis]